MALQIEFSLFLTGTSPLSSTSTLYNLAPDKLSPSNISVLYHCQLKEWEARALYVIQFLLAKPSHRRHCRHSVLTSLGACHILHLPGS